MTKATFIEMDLSKGIKVIVKVSAGARTEKVEMLEPHVFKIRVQAPPEKGKANKRVIELLSVQYGVPVSQVALASGGTHREKTFIVFGM